MIQFILASLSPRRRELLELCGYPFTIKSVPVNENSIIHPDPAENCVQTAQLKSKALAAGIELDPSAERYIIAADTIVALEGQMLGKPKDGVEAYRMLSSLRDQTHQVFTGVSIIEVNTGLEIHGHHAAAVTMRDYGDSEIARYIATGDPLDKAGAYAIQNHEFNPVSQLEGCFLGVMGLSICHLLQLISNFDIPFRADLPALCGAHHNFPCSLYDNLARKHSK